MKKLLRKKLLSPILAYLKKGMSVKKMSLTLALGISVGIMPLFGVSTWLLLILALFLKLNVPAIQLVNYGIAVFKYILFVPFLKLGHEIFFPNEAVVSMNNIFGQYHADFLGTFKTFWHMNLGGIMVWALLALPLGLLIYYRSQPFLQKQSMKLARVNG